MIEATRLCKYYNGIAAIRDVSFAVGRGSVLGLLGPNGSGKSTTLSILTGLLRPDSGCVELDGIAVSDDIKTYKRRLGYLPEEAHLYEYMTPAEYVATVGSLRSLPADFVGSRMTDLFEILGLGPAVIHTQLSGLSKGTRQKVLLIAAILHNPDLLILDEPSSGLDIAATHVLRAFIRRLAEAGKMIVLSSHLLDGLGDVCSDVVILSAGRVAAMGNASQLVASRGAGSLSDVFRSVSAPGSDIENTADQLASIVLR